MPSEGTLGGGNGGPFIAGFCIPIRHQEQEQKYDCWATCLAMIFQWKGVEFTREQILLAAPHHIPNYTYGEMASAAETNRVAKRLSKDVVSFEKVDNPKTQTADFWMQHINKFKPTITTINNHCRIIMGYNGVGQLIILDPGRKSSTQPEPMGIKFIQTHCIDAWVMK
jgi:ABC-type bacteriocin/lantibiotic exporter with double-glycine peptidase domain